MVSRKGIIGAASGGLAAALVIGLSVVWPGLDAQKTPPQDSSVWALQTGEGKRYARVNTAVGELDTVRQVTNPSAIVQSDSGAWLFTDNNGRVIPIDAAQPANLDEDALKADATATPAGTSGLTYAGEYAVYRTETGLVYGSTLKDGGAGQVNPAKEQAIADGTKGAEELPDYAALAATVNSKGVIFSYSAQDKSVMSYSIPRGEVIDRESVAGVGENVEMTTVGDTWVLYDSDKGELHEHGEKSARKLKLSANAVLARPLSSGKQTYAADEFGLIQINLDDDGTRRIVGAEGSERGTPARPAEFDGNVYAAWLGTSEGTMWRSNDGEVTLDYAGKTLDDTRTPRLTASGSAMILNETRSGWVWNVPNGTLIPSSQDWTLDRKLDDEAQVSEVQATQVLDPKPPVAVNDAFGVRAGAVASLPVMLNDHDPNKDVLSIDPGSLQGLDPSFGSLSLTDGNGRVSINVADTAKGTASFSYRVTDGTSDDGLYSNTATVTLTVVGAQQNAAPVWCGVNDCLSKWPAPEVKPGGTVRVPVLNGWVDPEGDPVMLLGVSQPSVGAAAVTQTGEVVYQNNDPSAQTVQVVDLDVTVADARGATSTRSLKVRVSPTAQIQAAGFTTVDSVGSDLTIDVGPHVTGTAGSVSIDTARVLDDKPAQVTVAPGSTSFDFVAKDPGDYQVAYTVKDTDGSQSDAIARVKLLAADAAPQLATSPVVAFVRPQEDATVDVFAAVNNPTRRVLMLSDVTWQADPGSNLQVDVVGQQFLRVTGATETGEPGRLGVVKYTVGDGYGAADARVSGQASVYMLKQPEDLAPIAVDDAVTVRAGAQVNIPVLTNDVAPSGAALMLDPRAVKTTGDGALAFSSESDVRYLAPKKPGTYTITYGVYSAGAPARMATATVRVTVIGNENNRPPRPKVLEGRVLAGQQVTIPFDSFGVDPDGDATVIDRIPTAPQKGSASITPDGTGIVYAAPPGTKGQMSFTYRVTDSFGESRNGTVRVGVLDQESNPSPVTFTDYVQVQMGSDSKVTVAPLANDIDPTGGKLKLKDVRPNLSERLDENQRNPEYDVWNKHIVSKDNDTVVVSAGTDPGTMSFLYDVTSSSGNTARGMIVVKVVRDEVPDYPVVTDTTLNVETREQFPKGVDVLDGKVSWTGGNASQLALSLWGSPSGVTAKGSVLSGPLPERAQIIPFEVSGPSQHGAEVKTYAFLRVPGQDDLQISLKASVQPYDVAEKASVSFNMNDLVARPRGTKLEVNSSAQTMQIRPQAACTVDTSSNVVTYSAGEGAPWSDACLVSARLEGQDQWTVLSVPIRVTAIDPVPVLRPAALTVEPGSSSSYDLKSMVTWQGREDWAKLRLAVAQPGGGLTVAQDGMRVTVKAADSAVPGSTLAASVTVTSHDNVIPAALNLTVGAAPSTLPRAGTLQQQCSASAGTSCTFRVVGAPGEVNPLPNTPLRLQSVAATAGCIGVSFAVADDNSVVASWAANTPGSTCTVPFQLTDAQDRPTGGDRAGRIYFDFRGYPAPPASVTQTRFADGTLGLQVIPGAAGASYPAVSGFEVTGPNGSITCGADGACPNISAPNGEKRKYEAVSVNAVGRSATSVATEAWSYRPPVAPASASAAPKPNGDVGGLVSLSISGIDAAQTKQLTVSAAGADTMTIPVGDGQTSATADFNIKANTPTAITVTPVARWQVPPGEGDGATSGQGTTTSGFGIGAPAIPTMTVSGERADPGSWRYSFIKIHGAAGGNGVEPTISIGAGDSCDQANDTELRVRNGQAARVSVCARSEYNGQVFGESKTTSQVTPGSKVPAPTGGQFVVAADGQAAPGEVKWVISDVILPNAPSGYRAKTDPDDPKTSSVYGSDPGINYWFESTDIFGMDKSPTAVLTPRAAPYQASAYWNVRSCKVGGELLLNTGGAGATPDVDYANAEFTVKVDGQPTTTITYAAAGNKVPVGATEVKIPLKVAPGAGFNTYETTFTATCSQ